jgi:hypothetical protein
MVKNKFSQHASSDGTVRTILDVGMGCVGVLVLSSVEHIKSGLLIKLHTCRPDLALRETNKYPCMMYITILQNSVKRR